MDTEEVAPSARNVLCVDFDKTLVEWGPLEGPFRWKDGALESLRLMVDRGYEVIVFTSRASQTWWYAHCRDGRDPVTFGLEQMAIVRATVAAAGFPAIRVTAEKVPALAYIDDRAITFRDNWGEIMELLPAL